MYLTIKKCNFNDVLHSLYIYILYIFKTKDKINTFLATHNINLLINTLLEALLTTNELAISYLSGSPCPNMQGSTANPKLSFDITKALKSYGIVLFHTVL